MKPFVFLMIVLAVCTHCTGGSPPSTSDGVTQTNAKATPPKSNTTAAQEQISKDVTTPGESGALRVYIDPETGEYTTPPAPEVPAARKLPSPAALSTSHEGLEEQPSPVPGGGTLVDLKGRFRSPLVATIDSNGKTKIEHQAIDNKE